MRSVLMLFLLLTAIVPAAVLGQHGGKAEPKRIVFATGKSSMTVTGSLSNGQEMEYVFAGTKDQIITIRNSNRNLFDFRVFSDEFGLETEFDSSPAATFPLPGTGDYMFFVRKKQVSSPRRARFLLTLTIQ